MAPDAPPRLRNLAFPHEQRRHEIPLRAFNDRPPGVGEQLAEVDPSRDSVDADVRSVRSNSSVMVPVCDPEGPESPLCGAKHHLAALGIAEADDRLHEGLAEIRTTPAYGLMPGSFGIYRLSR